MGLKPLKKCKRSGVHWQVLLCHFPKALPQDGGTYKYYTMCCPHLAKNEGWINNYVQIKNLYECFFTLFSRKTRFRVIEIICLSTYFVSKIILKRRAALMDQIKNSREWKHWDLSNRLVITMKNGKASVFY